MFSLVVQQMILGCAMPNTYFVPRAVLRQIDKTARKADIHEICYVLFGRGSHVHRALRIPNRAPDTVMHTVIETRDVNRARSRASVRRLHVIGYLHTHILSRALPSRGDVRGWNVGTLLFIYSELYQEFRAFRLIHRRPGYVEKRVVVES